MCYCSHKHINHSELLIKHPVVKKYMIGIFILRPPKPKLGFVWDLDILFRYLETFSTKTDNTSTFAWVS